MVETAIVVAKAVHSGGATVLFGALLFTIYARGETEGVNLRPLLTLAIAAAWAGSLALLLSETANIAGDAGAAFDPAVLSAVTFDTYFGKIWIGRLTILSVLTVLIFARPSQLVRIGQVIAGAALVASLALQGHPGAALADGNVLPAISDGAHALAAGAWLGALCVLMVMMSGQQDARAQSVSAALSRFSAIGPAIVGVIMLSGIANLWLALGAPVVSLFHSSYGAVLGVKILFFLGMLALAAAHRYVLAPKLVREIASDERVTIAGLRISVFAEAGLGALVLIAAATLGSTPPSIG